MFTSFRFHIPIWFILLSVIGALFMGVSWAQPNLSGFDEVGQNCTRANGCYNAGGGTGSADGLRNILILIFRAIAIALFITAVFVAFLSVIKLLSSENSEEDFKKWRRTLIWAAVGLLLLTISYRIVDELVNYGGARGDVVVFDGDLAARFSQNVLWPIIKIFQYLAALAFFFAAVFAYYRIVTALGDEAQTKAGRQSFLNAILGFILVMIVVPLVSFVYSGTRGCNTIFGRLQVDCETRAVAVDESLNAIGKIIVFLNSFVALVVLIFVIYAGVLLLMSGGNQDRVDRAKKILIYSLYGLVFLLLSYALLRFFFFQE